MIDGKSYEVFKIIFTFLTSVGTLKTVFSVYDFQAFISNHVVN
jgi:hypothetical protein